MLIDRSYLETFQKATRLTADGDLQSECASTEDEQNENLNEVKNVRDFIPRNLQNTIPFSSTSLCV